MLGRLEDLPGISSVDEAKGVIELELEEKVRDMSFISDDVVFVGRFCNSVVVCVGQIELYDVVRDDFAKLNIKGRMVSFSV